ncbi:hypothetical protein RUM44_012588, partial [Polyplax serrata]
MTVVVVNGRCQKKNEEGIPSENSPDADELVKKRTPTPENPRVSDETVKRQKSKEVERKTKPQKNLSTENLHTSHDKGQAFFIVLN